MHTYEPKENIHSDAEQAHQCNHSPYIFGRSPRIYASKVLFRTVDQSRSRLSCSGRLSSTTCGTAVLLRSACNADRATVSPAAKRGPRSGQLRDSSKGFHLVWSYIKHINVNDDHVPEVMEVVRICPFEEPIDA